MAITWVGYKNGRCQIKESVPGLKLLFTGEDADKFEQADPPADHIATAEFKVTVGYLRREYPGFLPSIQ